jgi:Helicase conserved C-terminal domain
LASRITLLPITLKDLKKNKLNFVSFTSGTSFNLRSNLGTQRERALLYWLLEEPWNLRGTGALNVLQGNAERDKFRALIRGFEDENEIDPGLRAEFAEALDRPVRSERAEMSSDLRTRFEDLCGRFSYSRKYLPQEDRDDRKRLVGELRALLAVTCLRSLEPDLIIMDEFQRFKHLLDGQDAASELARGLFEYEDVRVLLVSATPYKMYTVVDESGDDNHYEDFIRTLRFLEADTARTAQFEQQLAAFRQELFRLRDGDPTRLHTLKSGLEAELRRVMVRTERLAVTEGRDGMLAQIDAKNVRLDPLDLEAYLGLQALTRMLEKGDTLEYWKSSPYLLNFMEDYELKEAFEAANEDPARRGELARILGARPTGLLPWREIEQYGELDPGNARLRGLLADTIGVGAWRLLWIPPSLPYYCLGSPFSDAAVATFTKRLVFSAWRVVPRVLATMLSYEAERRMMRSLNATPENTPEARARRTPLLRFARADGRLTGMPVLGLLYPCTTLARECDPLAVGRQLSTSEVPDLDQILGLTRQRIDSLLSTVADTQSAPGSPEDEAWYWAAPILLDVRHHADSARAWLESGTVAARSSGADPSAVDEETSLWSEHVEQARRLLTEPHGLGPRPADLSLVLAQMAIAGPATVSLRALGRRSGDPSVLNLAALKDAAGQIAWTLRNLFNLPEVLALIRGRNNAEPYWRRVLEYCLAGGLQSVLDEYAHVLGDSVVKPDASIEEAATYISKAIRGALTIRTVTLAADDVRVAPSGTSVNVESRRLRARFALRLEGDQSEGGEEATRRDQVREAFNSPFWPFVLATTSVGQEGLDFHPYCHAVVHWNLPSNPVDLEQREGRVHRYKGHAVRRNLAKHYANTLARLGPRDPWRALFEFATKDRASDASDIVPFWVYAVEGGAKIERHVPALPLSRDFAQLAALRRSLAIYRMIFGQPRQEDLIAYLLEHFGPDEVERLTTELRIDLSPPRLGC